MHKMRKVTSDESKALADSPRSNLSAVCVSLSSTKLKKKKKKKSAPFG